MKTIEDYEQTLERIHEKKSEIKSLEKEIVRLKTTLPKIWYAYRDLPEFLIVSESREECVRYMNAIGMQVNSVDQCYYLDSPSGPVDAWISSATPLNDIWPELLKALEVRE